MVAAFNADKSGDRLADRLRELVGSGVRRDRPSDALGKDSNEHLKSLRGEHRARSEQGLDAHESGDGARVGSMGLVR